MKECVNALTDYAGSSLGNIQSAWYGHNLEYAFLSENQKDTEKKKTILTLKNRMVKAVNCKVCLVYSCTG